MSAATGTHQHGQQHGYYSQASDNYSSAGTASTHSNKPTKAKSSTSHTRPWKSDGDLTHRHRHMEARSP